MIKNEKVIKIEDNKGNLIGIQSYDIKKNSIITYTVKEVGIEESFSLLNKISDKTEVLIDFLKEDNVVSNIETSIPDLPY